MRRLLLGAVVPLALVAAWEIASRAGLTLDTLSRPSDILAALLSGLHDGSILIATAQTVDAALLGLAIAAVLGILVGAMLGLSPVLEAIAAPSVEALRPIPAVAFMPLALMMFGFGGCLVQAAAPTADITASASWSLMWIDTRPRRRAGITGSRPFSAPPGA